MKIGILFEWLFAGTHCDSQFAHFCLFLMLLTLLYSFINGVKEQLDAKDEEQRRKENSMQFEQMRQKEMRKHAKSTGEAQNSALPPGKKDFTDLQKEQMLKKILIEQLSLESLNLNKYMFVKDKPEINAIVYQKEDVENPIIRLDAVLDRSAKKLFDTLTDTEQMPIWFKERCRANKLVETLSSGSEIYLMILNLPQPINQLTIYYKRFIQSDEQKNQFKIIYSSKGLENYQPPSKFLRHLESSNTKIRLNENSHRAGFNQFGISLKSLGHEIGKASKNQTKIVHTQLFYIQQVDFGGYLLPTSSQVQLLSNFMFEFVEMACERSILLKPLGQQSDN